MKPPFPEYFICFPTTLSKSKNIGVPFFLVQIGALRLGGFRMKCSSEVRNLRLHGNWMMPMLVEYLEERRMKF